MQTVKQISSLEKVRGNEILECNEIFKTTCLKGEKISYQISVKSQEIVNGIIEVISPFGENVRVYNVLNAAMDMPITDSAAGDDINYITKEPGLMPDILQPISETDNVFMYWTTTKSLWIDVDVPADFKEGTYSVEVKCSDIETKEVTFSKKMEIEVCDKAILPQSLVYTRWFYADCIADYHNVEVYSEEHWHLIEEYIKQAVASGVNMILVPIHTPPLDTAVGTARTCVQLVDIEKKGDKYEFGFDRFKRFVDICKRSGVQYYEMAHFFSQWGAKATPNIMVTENGVKDYMFGWHVSASSDEYISFLKQYIAAISKELAAEGITENTYFHISDEPSLDNIDTYQTAFDIIKPLIGKSKTFDALSRYEFYEKGLVQCPVVGIAHIAPFLDKDIENLWAYYCCGPQKIFTNSLLAMPSSRTRILGVLLYKYNIKGFLHWGLNYYNGQVSRYNINPYVTTSADGRFPSGDPFILYPSKDGAYGCIRGRITRDAISDMDICRTLEQYIGREAVVKMIDDEAGMEVRFDNYPVDKEYLPKLTAKMKEIIKNK